MVPFTEADVVSMAYKSNYGLFFGSEIKFIKSLVKKEKFQVNHKKISDFLSDNKIAKIDRMKQCVIKDSNKNIVWVVGHQIHNSYRVTRKTSTVMDLQII